jgi:hypothetical protein
MILGPDAHLHYLSILSDTQAEEVDNKKTNFENNISSEKKIMCHKANAISISIGQMQISIAYTSSVIFRLTNKMEIRHIVTVKI